MKKYLMIIFMLLAIVKENSAQKIDYNSIILPSSAENVDFVEKLVRLAWENNPENEIIRRRVAISNQEVKQAKVDWLNRISISGNLNEFTIDPSRDLNNRGNFYPRYNVGASIPIGYFITNSKQIKLKKEGVTIANLALNSQKLAIRAAVLRLHQTYLKNEELLRLRTEAAENERATFSLAEQKFSNGELTIEEYNATVANYNQSLVAQINAESEFRISKINLEELTGVKMEDVQ